ncbi:MAG: hypothetical protein KDB88_04180 [Flavobacteriales bacterium]|nr:hypothetical protein [Flavobacteriales bacterium]
MISYHTFLLMDLAQRTECLHEHGRFLAVGMGPSSLEAYFVVNDFFVNVRMDQEDMAIMQLLPLRDLEQIGHLFYLIDEAEELEKDPNVVLVRSFFNGWCNSDPAIIN